MPELNPRRVAPARQRFAQVTAAVLSGMAAMFCLQNYIEFRRMVAAPPATVVTAPAPTPTSAEQERRLPPPDAVAPPPRLVESNIMLQPEPDMVKGGTVRGVAGEEAPPKFKEYVPEELKTPGKKTVVPHLQTRNMESRFASGAVRQDGRFSAIKQRVHEDAPPEPVVAKKDAPAPIPRGASGITLIEKAPSPAENLQPAPIAQLSVQEREFWTRERQFHLAVAVAVMMLGVLYTIYATGIRSKAPPVEGEL